jgi:hypothetical protein
VACKWTHKKKKYVVVVLIGLHHKIRIAVLMNMVIRAVIRSNQETCRGGEVL